MNSKKHLLISASLGFLLAFSSHISSHAYSIDGNTLVPLSLKKAPAGLLENSFTLIPNADGIRIKQPLIIAQVESGTNEQSDSITEDDISNFFVGLAVLMILPLFWKPARKAIGLLNIIVGTVL